MDPHRYNRHSMFLRKDNDISNSLSSLSAVACASFLACLLVSDFGASVPLHCNASIEPQTEEDVGLLVQLGFDITAFTPAAYQRGSLPRPSQMTHLEDGFALRCFQRLS